MKYEITEILDIYPISTEEAANRIVGRIEKKLARLHHLGVLTVDQYRLCLEEFSVPGIDVSLCDGRYAWVTEVPRIPRIPVYRDEYGMIKRVPSDGTFARLHALPGQVDLQDNLEDPAEEGE